MLGGGAATTGAKRRRGELDRKGSEEGELDGGRSTRRRDSGLPLGWGAVLPKRKGAASEFDSGFQFER